MMKIITYNVNGLRAAVSKGLPEWLAQENPDILCLQETKLQPDQYPGEVFEAIGLQSLNLYSAQKKGIQWSGYTYQAGTGPCGIWDGNGSNTIMKDVSFVRTSETCR